MREYETTWDRPHMPGPHELWQESDWLTFYDRATGVGGVYRIGQQPNAGQGQPSLFVFARDGDRYLMPDFGPDAEITAEDRWDTGYRVAGHSVESLGDGRLRYSWDYPETSGEVEFFQSFYVPRDWSKTGRGADVIESLNADGHLECTGRVTGHLVIGSSAYDIDALAHRDRSWGYRDHYMTRMRRAFGVWGSIGKEFSFATMLLDLNDGRLLTTGFVDREGVSDDIVDIRLRTTLDADFVSPISGVLDLILENGEVVQVKCEVAQAYGGFAPGTSFNSVGILHYQGELGFCDLSATANPSRGAYMLTPSDVTSLTVHRGLSKTVAL